MLLSIDTSTRFAGVALYDGVHVIGEVTWVSQDHHTVELSPVIAGILDRAGKQVADLKVVGVAIGPGSFTGLRIGLAVAKGLALASRLALVGVPTMDITAAGQPVQDLPLAVGIQAGRGRLAVAWYTAHVQAGVWRMLRPAEIMDIHTLSNQIRQPTLVCGEFTGEEQRLLRRKRKNVLLASPAQSLRRPAVLAELAWQRWQDGNVDDPVKLAPIYLHIGATIPG